MVSTTRCIYTCPVSSGMCPRPPPEVVWTIEFILVSNAFRRGIYTWSFHDWIAIRSDKTHEVTSVNSPLDVRQAALSVAHKMRWRCRCRCILMLFLAYPVEPTGCSAAHSKYCGKREHQCRKMLFTSKLEPSCSHRTHFLERPLSPLHSRLAQESQCLESHVKLI